MPKESTINKLELHRFVISPESFEVMDEIKEFFLELQHDYPELKSMAFFGSRTLGKEHARSVETIEHSGLGKATNIIPESDYDIILFYDADEMSEFESGIQKKDRTKEIQSKFIGFSKHLKAEKELSQSIHLNAINISKSATEAAIREYKKQILAAKLKPPLVIYFNLNESNPFFTLAARFLLSIGNVKLVREPIIADFENGESGEYFWKILMKVLNEFERPVEKEGKVEPTGLPAYKYPTSLKAARKYFLM
jgi:hypothetical protein